MKRAWRRTLCVATQSDATSRWYRNADDIAGFPKARLSGDWAGDVATYDKVVTEIFEMSDMLADDIVAEVPGPVLLARGPFP